MGLLDWPSGLNVGSRLLSGSYPIGLKFKIHFGLKVLAEGLVLW